MIKLCIKYYYKINKIYVQNYYTHTGTHVMQLNRNVVLQNVQNIVNNTYFVNVNRLYPRSASKLGSLEFFYFFIFQILFFLKTASFHFKPCKLFHLNQNLYWLFHITCRLCSSQGHDMFPILTNTILLTCITLTVVT